MTDTPDNFPTGRRQRILVVDDDPDALWLVVDALAEHGFEVAQAGDGEQAKQQIGAHRPNLVILDLGLPDIGGLDILKWLRTKGDIPVIVLTGRSDPSDRVVGLELGADDYVVKPFEPRELVARVNAVLRRGRTAAADQRLDFGSLSIDLATRDVTLDGAFVDLTAKEFDLLAFLAAAPRQVFNREQLLDYVWASSSEWQDPSTVSEHIHRLRRKIETDPGRPQWIDTLRGAGYRFTPNR